MGHFIRVTAIVTALVLAPGLWASCGGSAEGESAISGTYYVDADGDGYGDVSVSQFLDSEQAGWVLDSTDCDDTPVTGASIHPGAAEICDDADNDCDDVVDDGGVCDTTDSGGVPVSGYPGWQERTLLVLTNAVRMDPTGWRDKYYPYSTTLPSGSGILIPANYPAVGALFYTGSFNQSARYHSEDMADNCDLQHNSCDGTVWSTRLVSYYGVDYSSLGENAAYNVDPGNGSPLFTLNQLLCDKVGSVCSADDSATDGHRANIMNGVFVESGMGYAYSYRMVVGDFYDTHWWTMDFGSKDDQPVFKPVLVAGSHEMTGNTLTYFANYYSPADTAQGVDLVLDGAPVTMSLDMGALDAGTWSVKAATASSCQSYYFEATDSAGQVWRYPGEGEFKTYGIGSCSEDYEGE